MSLSSKKCCVPGCLDSGGMKAPLHLFPNPVKDKERFNLWVFYIRGDIIGMDDDDIYKHRRVCHAHFEEKFCCRNDRLSNIALPTLHLPGSTSMPKFSFAERRPLRQTENIESEHILPSTSRTPTVRDINSLITFSTGAENIDPAINAPEIFSVVSTIKVPEVSVKAAKSALADQAGSTAVTHPAFEFLTYSRQIPQSTVEVPSELSQSSQSNLGDNTAKNINLEDSSHIPQSTREVLEEPMSQLTQSDVRVHSTKNIETRSTKRARTFVARKIKLVTKLEHQLHQQLIQVKARISKYRSKVKKQSICIKAAKKLTLSPTFIEAIEKMPNTAKILTMMQFRELKKKDKGRRFTMEEKIVALSILKQGPKCYRFLRKIFILPAPQTLTKLISKANIKPGINDNLFSQIKKATEGVKIEDRLCILLFDEMSLKANITYNERKDYVSGFVTDGQNTKPEYADHAQVFMIRGLIRNYKQPVSYTFSAAATSGPELAKQLRVVIRELQKAGLIVVATVSDQGTNNRNAIKLLIQETRGELIRSGKEPKDNIFIINEQEIIPLYDPPHLIKCIRNNLLTKHLVYNTCDSGNRPTARTAKWQHIEMLYQENPGYKGIRLIPKLTDSHVIPHKILKMKVKYATQVFSRTVASNMGYLADKGILPKDCVDTSDLLLFFDELFDSVNGSYSKRHKYGKPLLGPVKPNSIHHNVWIRAKKMLKTMKFVNITTGRPEKVPTIANWAWTLDGMQLLLNKLKNKYNITSIWMRHLNQDPLENFFGAIRSHGCRNTNPTTSIFESAYVSLLINNLSSVHAPGANCENDYAKLLNTLIIADDCQAKKCDFEGLPVVDVIELTEKNDPRVLGPLRYVSGYFVNHTKKKVFENCITCLNDMVAPRTADEHDYLNRREYAGRNWLVNPSESFLSCISAIQDINNAVLKKNLTCNNFKELIKTMIFCHIATTFEFIRCDIHKDKLIDHIINLTTRFFIYNYCKDINKILQGRRDSSDDNDYFQIKAKQYFHKCFKRRNK